MHARKSNSARAGLARPRRGARKTQGARRPRLESLESRQLLAAADILISELMAENAATIQDGNGASSDWIELHNSGSDDIDLLGWHLTDDASNLTKWTFPSQTLAADQRLVVFASGDDAPDGDGRLHTNFQLNSNGDYLALVQPDGATINSEFAPAFPALTEDVSYGLGTLAPLQLFGEDAPAKVLIPSSDALGTEWTSPSFDDGSWPAATASVGFDTSSVNGLIQRWDFESGDLQGFNHVAGTAFNNQPTFGDNPGARGRGPIGMQGDYFVGTYENRPAPANPAGATQGDGPTGIVETEPFVLGEQARFEFLMGGGSHPWSSAWDPDTVLGLGDFTGVNLERQVGPNDWQMAFTATGANDEVLGTRVWDAGAFARETVRLRIYDLHTGGWGHPNVDDIRYTGVSDAFLSDLETAMHGQNSTAYLRIPFELPAADDYDLLRLRIAYNDGFVAYLNGVEVARRNASGTAWNAAATATAAAEGFEVIDISSHISLLNANGPNLLAIHGQNVSADDGDFEIRAQLTLHSSLRQLRYFVEPTPGLPNNPGVAGLVADTSFDVDRGFFTAPIDVAVSTATPDAVIHYTLDGSEPTATHGEVYDGPIHIATTTTLRAAAFVDDFAPSNVDTQTYLFLQDVIRQPGNPAGFPSTWNNYLIGSLTGSPVPADYAMNQTVVDSHAATIIDDLLSLPTMSIVLDNDQLFGSANGIYVNPFMSGDQREKTASIEWIDPDGQTSFQLNAGLRISGGWSRHFWATPKKTFTLRFRRDHGGPPKLNFPLFAEHQADSAVAAADQFETIMLRGVFSDAWPDAASPPQYLRDLNARYAQLAMGQPSSHGTWVHLYLNGLYWGIYNPSERPDADFAASYFGGEASQYDAIKHAGLCAPGCAVNNQYEVIDGDAIAFQQALNLAAAGLASDAAYEEFQKLVDVENLADYIILEEYLGNTDWPHKNWYATRKREEGAGFKFYVWDSEYTLNDVNVNRLNVNNPNTPAFLYSAARQNADFRRMFGDRVHQHLFNDGALQPQQNIARYEALASQIEAAVRAESARWGDNGDTRKGATYFTYEGNWLPVKNSILTNFFPQRHNIALSHFRSAGLYPSVAAPSFNEHGGKVAEGFQLTIGAATGVIYYTLDGSDPWDNGVAAGAMLYAGPITIAENTTVKARAVTGGGSQWSALNEANFLVDLPSSLRVTEIMYNPLGGGDTEYLQLQNIGGAPLQLAGYRFVEGIDFEFPEMELAAGDRVLVVQDLAAFQAEYGNPGLVAGQFQSGRLSNGGERLALADAFGQTILDFEYNDSWYPITDGQGFSLVAVDPNLAVTAWSEEAAWRPSVRGGSPGVDDDYTGALPGHIVINEIMSHTDAATGDWIELHNTTGQDIDLQHWYLSDDPSNAAKLQILASKVVPAGGYLVLTEQQDFGLLVDLEHGFGLSELGDELSLASGLSGGGLAGFQTVLEFGAADNGVAFGRYLNSVADVDFVALQAETPGAANSRPRVGPLVINEIMYHPADGGVEFIELHNLDSSATVLFDPAHPDNAWKLKRGVDFDFPAGIEVPANGYLLVVGGDPEQFRAAHALPPQLTILGPFSGALDNGGDSIRLMKPGAPELDGSVPEIQVDRVRYRDQPPWPAEADGQGASLERIQSGQYGNDPSNWMRSSFAGSPGAVNFGSDTTPPSPPQLDSVVVSGNTQVTLSWLLAEDPESGIESYQIYRDGRWIGSQTSGNTFVDDAYDPTRTAAYSVAAINRDGIEGPRGSVSLVSSLASGIHDTQLAQQSPALNLGSAVTLRADNDDPDGSQQQSAILLRWDLDGMPRGASIGSASVTLKLTTATSLSFELYALQRPWVESEANWNEFAAGQSWDAPGAMGAMDRGAELLGTMENTAPGSQTIQFTEAGRALVQSWIQGAAENHGVILVPASDATPGGSSEVLQDLIAFYDFEQMVGNQALDTSGNGRNGVISGAVATTSGFDGGAFRFSGSGHVVAPIDINPSLRPRFTMGAWVRSDTLGSGLYKILGHDNGGYDRTIGLDNRGLGGFRWTAFIGNGTPIPNTPTPVFDQWTFIAASYDNAAGSMTLYIDTDAATTNDAVQAFTNATGFNPGQTSVSIGSLRPDNFSEGFRGVMDNVFFFDDSLSLDEITQLRDLGVAFFQGDGVEVSSREAAPALRPRLDLAYTLPFTVISVAANTQLADPPDTAQGAQPTSWQAQRSDLRGISVRFNQAPVLTSSDLLLVNLGVDAPGDQDIAIPLTDDQLIIRENELHILFDTDELDDGVYALTVHSSVSSTLGDALDGDADGAPGDAYAIVGNGQNKLYQIAADFNGDGGVSIFDFPAFAYWFGQNAGLQGPAPRYADLNRDGGITIFDFPVFAANFGAAVVFPSPGFLSPAVALAAPTEPIERIRLDEKRRARDLEEDQLADQVVDPNWPAPALRDIALHRHLRESGDTDKVTDLEGLLDEILDSTRQP